MTAQLALSLVVLSTGFLFLRNLFPGQRHQPRLRRAAHDPPGGAHSPRCATKDPEQLLLYASRALRELKAIPGIQAAAAARVIPFRDRTYFGSLIAFPDTE